MSCAFVTVACDEDTASRAELDAYAARAGTLIEADTTFIGSRGRYAVFGVRLRSSTSVIATGRLLTPSRASVPSAMLPAVLLANGRELNSRAVDHLPADFGDVVVLSLDYPEELPYQLRLRTVLARSDAIQRAARRVPSVFIVGRTYLASRVDVARDRIALVASSFAVPFAAIAAAADSGFRNVALIYGAGDLAEVIAANLTVRPAPLRGPLGWVATRPFAEFSPERFVSHIAPRPIIMVNGIDDPQMPRSAVEALYRSAREPKSIVWLRTGHLMPGDTALIRQLADTALNRLPVLQRRQP